jgi:DNA-binding transcriptional MerR regulator
MGPTTGASEVRQYSSREVARITRITPRQLQWWDEQGIVRPLREGRNRAYNFLDLAELMVISELRRKGFSLQGVRKVMRYLQKRLGKRLAEVVADGGEYHLLTDGRSIYLESSAQGVVDVLKNADQALFGVCLSDTVERLKAKCSTKSEAVGGSKARRSLDRHSSEKPHPTKKNVKVTPVRAA